MEWVGRWVGGWVGGRTDGQKDGQTLPDFMTVGTFVSCLYSPEGTPGTHFC